MNPFVQMLLEGAWPGLVTAGLFMALLPWIPLESRWRALAAGLTLLLGVRYLLWRLTDTIPPLSQPLNFTAGVAFFAIELAASIGTVLSLVTLSRYRNRSDEVDAILARHERDGVKPPRVSVFICTYNEDRNILEHTIVGAVAMDYPSYDVWVLDDGRRDWLQELAAETGCRYLTRPDNRHAKAGNINHALEHLRAIGREPEFISILDADFVPGKRFLQRALALFDEGDVGVVQTPQHFFNPDPIQANLGAAEVWPDEQRYFFDSIMASKDAWGTAFCCGTSSVIRYRALREIGGFPTDSVTEDYLLTLRMVRNGWRTVYLNERLSLGLAPEGLNEYITQRSRWCLGFVQIFRGDDGPFKLDNGLRLVDRLALVESFFYWSGSFLFRIAAFVVPVLYLMFDIHALDAEVRDGISHFLPYFVAQVAFTGWLSEGRVLPVMTDVTQLLAAREILAAVTIGLFKPKGHKFKVTAKGIDRKHTVIQWRLMSMFVVLLALTMASILWAFDLDPSHTVRESSSIALAWAWYNMVVLLIAMQVAVEKPRQRKYERLHADETVVVEIDGECQQLVMRDISLTGVRLAGRVAAPLGTSIKVWFANDMLEGRIVRVDPTSFAIGFPDTLAVRLITTPYVYSGHFKFGTQGAKPTKVVRAVLAQLMD